MKRLAIITTHPIQYNAPLFSMLQKRGNIAVKVFYTWGDTVLQKKYDPGFSKAIEWDIPLLEGYEYEFLENSAKEKGSHHYKGIVNNDIIKKVESWRADAVLVYGWKFHSHLRVMRHFKNKIPVWFRGDSILLNEKKNIKSFFKNFLLKWVYRHIDIAFYTGTNNKIYFEKNGLKHSQLIKAFHAVDNTRFYNIANRYSDGALTIRNELGIKRKDFVFLFAGKLIPTKDIGNLIKAFKEIAKENVHLIIVGNGPEENKLKNNFGHSKNLHFLDFQNQAMMPVIYQLCDVFILPSIGETWGLSINEAMAAGKAILASDQCGGAIDLVLDGENGYIFKAGDIDDLIFSMK
ncbi:MAG: glycosyltransferase family 4 protein, partial [Bacteroidota bacterium]|nr:glycosyltransferase family 4 protein [Bacteroidota bacterium]